jgi:hypothetical protein
LLVGAIVAGDLFMRGAEELIVELHTTIKQMGAALQVDYDGGDDCGGGGGYDDDGGGGGGYDDEVDNWLL